MSTSDAGTSSALVDWSRWEPQDLATILFVRRGAERANGGDILLIRKKRGLGAGKINGPGGRVDPGETVTACALREIREELRIEAGEPRHLGTLRFQFRDGYALMVFVFVSKSHTGTPEETDEAVPLWFPVQDVPFAEMWADDELWFPMLLRDQPYEGSFFFDDDEMGPHSLQACSKDDAARLLRGADALQRRRHPRPDG